MFKGRQGGDDAGRKIFAGVMTVTCVIIIIFFSMTNSVLLQMNVSFFFLLCLVDLPLPQKIKS